MSGRVLWIEDNRDDVIFLTAAVGKLDTSIQIDAFDTGEKALEHLAGIHSRKREWPDLILLDLNLPGRNGHEVLTNLKSDPQYREIPIVVLTTSRSDRDRKRAIENHANAYLVKPHDFREYESLAVALNAFWFQWACVRPDLPSGVH